MRCRFIQYRVALTSGLCGFVFSSHVVYPRVSFACSFGKLRIIRDVASVTVVEQVVVIIVVHFRSRSHALPTRGTSQLSVWQDSDQGINTKPRDSRPEYRASTPDDWANDAAPKDEFDKLNVPWKPPKWLHGVGMRFSK